MRWERTRWHHDRWSCFYRQQREAICWCALWPRNLSLSSILHILCTQIAHLSLSSLPLHCFFHRQDPMVTTAPCIATTQNPSPTWERVFFCWCALSSLSSILLILCTQIAHLSLSSPSLRCFFHRRMGIEGNIVIGHGLKVFQRSQKSQPTPSLSSLSLPLTLCLVANGGRKKKKKN